MSSNNPNPFVAGAMVVITLANPREKFWGMILSLAPEGMSVSGVDLASFENLGTMVKEGEPFTPSVVFFPMHRVERAETDLPMGELPSLSQRFFSTTGLSPAAVLTPSDGEHLEPSDLSHPHVREHDSEETA